MLEALVKPRLTAREIASDAVVETILLRNAGSPPRCAICSDKGLLSRHRLGSERCESLLNSRSRTNNRINRSANDTRSRQANADIRDNRTSNG